MNAREPSGPERPILYYTPTTRAVRPRWLLEEMGVDYELRRIDLRSGEGQRPDYLSIHPLGKVPALSMGKTTIFESLAICMYLADRYPDRGMAPAMDASDRAAYCQWMAFSAGTLEPAAVDALYRKKAAARGGTVPVIRGFLASLNGALDTIETALADGGFLLGDRFTAADIMNASLLMFAERQGLLDGRDRLVAWLDVLRDRPAYQRSTAD